MPLLSPSEEACLYRVIKESVSNVSRHAGAAQFEVRMAFSGSRASVSIEDDGDGFDPDRVMSGRNPRAWACKSIRDRMLDEAGTFNISSGDAGTAISIEMPIGGSS